MLEVHSHQTQASSHNNNSVSDYKHPIQGSQLHSGYFYNMSTAQSRQVVGRCFDFFTVYLLRLLCGFIYGYWFLRWYWYRNRPKIKIPYT